MHVPAQQVVLVLAHVGEVEGEAGAEFPIEADGQLVGDRRPGIGVVARVGARLVLRPLDVVQPGLLIPVELLLAALPGMESVQLTGDGGPVEAPPVPAEDGLGVVVEPDVEAEPRPEVGPVELLSRTGHGSLRVESERHEVVHEQVVHVLAEAAHRLHPHPGGHGDPVPDVDDVFDVGRRLLELSPDVVGRSGDDPVGTAVAVDVVADPARVVGAGHVAAVDAVGAVRVHDAELEVMVRAHPVAREMTDLCLHVRARLFEDVVPRHARRTGSHCRCRRCSRDSRVVRFAEIARGVETRYPDLIEGLGGQDVGDAPEGHRGVLAAVGGDRGKGARHRRGRRE